MALVVMYITNNVDVAVVAEKSGVDRIWIDLETRGKEERQKNMNTVKSHHTVADIASIKPHLTTAEMLVRINPWYEGSRKEVDDVIAAGADIVMLPMWKSKAEVHSFARAVNGRAKTVLLLETKEAVDCLDDVLSIGEADEIHIGLNDLHLSYGMTFMFELLADGTVETLCNKIRAAGIPYGFGGIARLGQGMLPAEKVILEHYRLGSTRAILSRSFCDTTEATNIDHIKRVFAEGMKELREYEKYAQTANPAVYAANHAAIISSVAAVVNGLQEMRIRHA